MCDKIVIVEQGKVFAWFAEASFYHHGEEYVLRPKDESVLNQSQQAIKERYQYVPDVQISVRQASEHQGETNVVVVSKSSPILRNEKNIITKNLLVLTPDGELHRETNSQFVFEARKGIKYVDINFTTPTKIPQYCILSTLNDEEHRQLTLMVYKHGPIASILRVIDQKGNFFRNQGDLEKATQYYTKETVVELTYVDKNLDVKMHSCSTELDAA